MSLLDRYMDDLESRREKAGSDPSDYEDVGGVATEQLRQMQAKRER